jgi:hypothetical protein
MVVQQKRHRGGQPGNRNAVKHGFYSSSFNKQERFDFNAAAGMEGITEEIALLRFEIKKAISGGDIDHLLPLSRAVYALEKLVRTHHRIFVAAKQNVLETGIRNVFNEILLPIGGIDLARKAAHSVFPDEFPPGTPSNQDQKTNNGLNEAGLP